MQGKFWGDAANLVLGSQERILGEGKGLAEPNLLLGAATPGASSFPRSQTAADKESFCRYVAGEISRVTSDLHGSSFPASANRHVAVCSPSKRVGGKLR